MVNIPDPVKHGWKVGDDGSIEIDWMDCQPAPDEVFLNQNVSQCKWQWAMIVLLISYKYLTLATLLIALCAPGYI